jgi:hypothetical protein
MMLIIDNNILERSLLLIVCLTEVCSKGNLSTVGHVDFMVKQVTF